MLASRSLALVPPCRFGNSPSVSPDTSAGARMGAAQRLLGVVLLLGTTNFGAVTEVSVADTVARPNVVMILSDDQSYRDFGFMGNDRVHTPHLDELARQSVLFPNGYVSMSVCRPSLATFLTGLDPHQHGIHFNHPPPGLSAMRKMSARRYHQTRASVDPFIRGVATLPRILARHGYACLQTGKHWEGRYSNAGFTQGMTTGLPDESIGAVTGTRLQENGEPVAHGNGDSGLPIGRETMLPIDEFIGRHHGKNPFLIWYAPFLPHTPFDADDRFREPLQDSNLPGHLLPYYAEINRLDETVGKLIETLDARGLMDSTLIVFAVDNGFRPDSRRPGRHDSASKLSVDEDGIRTPILFRWDGKITAGTHESLVHAVDIVPTVLSMVGLDGEITPTMRGTDLANILRGLDAPSGDRIVCGAIYPNDAESLGQPSRHVRGRWIRWKRWKLVVPGSTSPPLEPAFFDLNADPSESVNLRDDAAHAATIDVMHERLDRWWTGEDDTALVPKR